MNTIGKNMSGMWTPPDVNLLPWSQGGHISELFVVSPMTFFSVAVFSRRRCVRTHSIFLPHFCLKIALWYCQPPPLHLNANCCPEPTTNTDSAHKHSAGPVGESRHGNRRAKMHSRSTCTQCGEERGGIKYIDPQNTDCWIFYEGTVIRPAVRSTGILCVCSTLDE